MTLEPRVYTPQEYADTMKVSVKTIYRQLRAGTLKAQRIGRQWRISRVVRQDSTGHERSMR